MHIKLDKNADALYVKLKKGTIAITKDTGEFLVDFDKKGELLGFEILSFSKKIPLHYQEVMAVGGGADANF